MSLDSNDMVMPVAPYYGGNGNGNGGLFGGGDGWLAILFLFALMGGGMGGFGGFGGGMFPWLFASNANTDNNVNAGFNQAATAGSLAGINSAITSGFANAETAACNRAMDAMQTSYNNQIASMNQSFANSQALDSRLDTIAMNLQNCCCENRANIADLKYTVATEACADRAAVNDALRDVLTANTASTQRILDQMCQDKIDAKNEKIADLERQLTMANLAASQVAQTSAIVNQTYDRLSTCPVGTVPVYGEQPIFSCPNNNGCGCGCNGGNF